MLCPLLKRVEMATPLRQVVRPQIKQKGVKKMKNEYRGYRVGDKITIENMDGEPQYCGRTGEITVIDDIGQLHGTWGGLAVNLDYDTIRKVG